MSEDCPYCSSSFDTKQGVSQHCRHSHDGKSWIPREALVGMYTDRQLTTSDIASEFDCSKKTIRQTLDQYDIERRDVERDRQLSYLRNPASFQTKSSGYERWTTQHNGDHFRVYVHRLLAVAKYGFDAVAGSEVDVHHKTGIPWDNRPENIELLSKSEHGKMHAMERWDGEAAD